MIWARSARRTKPFFVSGNHKPSFITAKTCLLTFIPLPSDSELAVQMGCTMFSTVFMFLEVLLLVFNYGGSDFIGLSSVKEVHRCVRE